MNRMEQVEKHIVYQIQGDAESVLYVGITKRMSQRLRREHFTQNGHLDAACYRDARAIFYHECISHEDAAFREAYLIKTLNPRFNEKLNNPGKFSFSISFDWQYLPVDTSLLSKRLPARRHRRKIPHQLPTFHEAKSLLGVQLSFDCSPAIIDGPIPSVTWLNGDELRRIIDKAWAEAGAPGPLITIDAAFVGRTLADQDWTCNIDFSCLTEPEDSQPMRPRVCPRGKLDRRVPEVSASGEADVSDELSRHAQSWHRASSPRSLVGTLATKLDLTLQLYNRRDSYLLGLIYLSEVLQAGMLVENRHVILTADLQRGLVHDWFVSQSQSAGYNVWISGVEIQPDQDQSSKVYSNGRLNEEGCRRHEEGFRVGRNVARRLNQAVWVYSLSEVQDLQLALNVELQRLLEGATGVYYHKEQFPFQNYYDRCALSDRPSPKRI